MRKSRNPQTLTRRTIDRLLALALASAASILISACGGDSTSPGGNGPPESSPAGNYAITTVNGKSLPAAVFDDPLYKVEVTAGSITLATDGKYVVVTNFRQTIPDDVSLYSDSTFGTWAQSGAQINLTSAQDASVKDQGTWAGAQLTFALTDGKTTTTYVYTRK